MHKDLVAIVVPCYKRELSPDERLSYRRIWSLYGHLPIILMVPEALDVSHFVAEQPSLRIERFSFRTLRDYSQLLLNPAFYARFQQYRFILIHQLDAYVLRDELAEWCERGYDYIGAPLFHDFEPAEPVGKLWRVGNGGFSLRNVEAALHVLNSRRRFLTPQQYWKQTGDPARFAAKLRRVLEALSKATRWHNDVRWATLCNFHEDVFWSVDAAHFWPRFKTADLKTGLQFAFDYAPAYCFEQNEGQLPFGCHAWPRYDAPFWRQYIPEMTASPCF